jgi:hypothetical protein
MEWLACDPRMALLFRRCCVRVEKHKSRYRAEAWAVRVVRAFYPRRDGVPLYLPSGACKAGRSPGTLIRRAVRDREFRDTVEAVLDTGLVREFADALEAARDINEEDTFLRQQRTDEKSAT